MSQACHKITPQEGKSPFFAGVDLAENGIKVGVVDDSGRPLSRVDILAEVDKGADSAVCRIGAALGEAIGLAGLEPAAVARVGIGAPGPIDVPGGRLVQPLELKGWEGFPLRDRLSSLCGLPVAVARDSDAAAFGESWVGAGRGFHSLTLLVLGTRIGCGIILGGVPLSNERGHGGECGHSIIDCAEDARLCSCGRRGHVEAYVGAAAVLEQARQLLSAGRKSSLAQRVSAGDPLNLDLLAAAVEQGDELSLEVVLDAARCLGIGIVNLLHTVDPNAVLLSGPMTLGGSQSEAGRRFLARVQEEVRNRAFALLAKETTIDFARLGDEAGLLGAAGLARLEHLKGNRQ